MIPVTDPSPSNTQQYCWERRQEISGLITSGFLHLAFLLTLALFLLPRPPEPAGAIELDTEVSGGVEEFAPLVDTPIEMPQIAPKLPQPQPEPVAELTEQEKPPEALPALTLNLPPVMGGGGGQAELSTLKAGAAAGPGNGGAGEGPQGDGDLFKALAAQGEFSGRTAAGRMALARASGGTPESEAAVDAGLEWLKRHQSLDGSWNFDHRCPDCDYTCTEPGHLIDATVASTSMAMLCFAGAGYSHEEGLYQEEMAKGLSFLMGEARRAQNPGDMRQVPTGNSGMYAQGLATMLLCELYGMTRDEGVGEAAKKGVKFILAAQHPENGGWRYLPQDPRGDTSVAGWEAMALTSAKMSRLGVPKRNLDLLDRYLDSVQLEGGAFYGYTRPEKRASTTAIGLLLRMYQGWKRDHRGLKKGVLALARIGPNRDDMYYNYYATQVMHHWGGQEWRHWNALMRDHLVATQVTGKHSAGSWAPRDPHSGPGGRLYMTSLAILTLEVYYRHLPLYQERAVDADR